MYSLCVSSSLFAPLRTRSESAADSTKKQIRNCILLILNSRHSNLPIPLSLRIRKWKPPCPITRIYRFRYSSIFTRISYLLCISLILPRQFHAKREIANDVRDRYIIFFHFVFARTRSVRAVGSTKKQIRNCICFFVSFLHKIAVISQTKNTVPKPCLFHIWEVRQRFFYFLAVLAFFFFKYAK